MLNMKNYCIKFYIGANNLTEEVELEKIKKILLDNQIYGYTIYNTQGIWEENKEKSVVVEYLHSKDFTNSEFGALDLWYIDFHNGFVKLKEILEHELQQKSVILTIQELIIVGL